jgi:hypothetical protein
MHRNREVPSRENNGEQAIDKVLSFNSTDNRTVMQEICNAIRAITEIPAGLDVAARTLTLHGTSDRVEVAEWLLVQLDQPVAAQKRPVEPVTAGKSLPGIKGGTEIVDILYSGSDYRPQPDAGGCCGSRVARGQLWLRGHLEHKRRREAEQFAPCRCSGDNQRQGGAGLDQLPDSRQWTRWFPVSPRSRPPARPQSPSEG